MDIKDGGKNIKKDMKVSKNVELVNKSAHKPGTLQLPF